MENTEPVRFGHEPEGMSKRRISSILKAPRTSMKVCGADQDEPEETRPIEKRRNSRRVSFATKNNVHVFSKDIKVDSPVLDPIQNLHFVGLDTMVNIPLHISRLSKENFFPDPVLPDEPVDRTILLGEDTGYMDMTQSHTITIDNEVGMNPEFSFNIVENVTGLQKVKSQDDITSKTIAQKEGANVQSDFSDFLASISNPASQNAQNIVTSSSKKNSNNLCLEDATSISMDKENLLPSRLTKNVHCTISAPNSQPIGLQPRSYTASFLEQENMDLTKSHTVVIGGRGPAHHDAYPVCMNPKSAALMAQSFSKDSDDMEITHVHTTTINFKDVRSKQLVVDDNTSHFAGDTSSRMIMTQVLDGCLQEQERKVTTVDEPVFSQAHMSSFNRSQNRNVSDRSKIDQFQSNISNATMAFSDDMEITQANTVFLDLKGEELFSKSRKDSSFATSSSRTNDSGRALIASEQQSVLLLEKEHGSQKHVRTTENTIVFNDQNDLMELTCQANSSVMVMSPSPDEMDLTGCNIATIDAENILPTTGVKSTKRTSFMSVPTVSVEAKKVDFARSDSTVPHMDDDDDEMEMTQCQTVVLESKHCMQQTSFSNSRKSFSVRSGSCRSDVGSSDCEEMAHKLSVFTEQNRSSDFEGKTDYMDMDLTGCNNVTINPKHILTTSGVKSRKQTSFMSAPAVSVEAKKVNCVQGDTTVTHMDDEMEMTKCQTVVLESKNCIKQIPFSSSKKTLSFFSGSSRSDVGSRDGEEMAHTLSVHTEHHWSSDFERKTDYMDMDLTECNNVNRNPENILPTSGVKSRKRTSFMSVPTVSVEAKKVSCVQSDSTVTRMEDEMEMTKCQTVVLKSKNCVKQIPFSSSCNTLSFIPGSCRSDVGSKDYKEMAFKLAVQSEQHRSSDFERKSATCIVPSANTFHQDLPDGMVSAVQVDMDLTGCNTISIDTKSPTVAGTSHSLTQDPLEVLSFRPVALAKDQMEMSEVGEKTEKVDVDTRTPVASQKEVSLADLGVDKDQAVVTNFNHFEASCVNNVKEGSSLATNIEPSEEDCDMEMTKAMTVPLKLGEIVKEKDLSATTAQRTDHALPENQNTKLTPIITEGFAAESELCVKNDKPNSAKSRRRSLADLQVKLQNIAQCINEPAEIQTRSYTAPLSHLTDFEACPGELSERDTSTEIQETPTLINTASSANIESTAPFNLKSFLTARLSLGGITPKLPSRSKSASPNQTEPICTNRFQSLQLEAHMDGDIQNSYDVMNMIEDEVLPEEDFSDTVMSYLSSKKDEQDVAAVAPSGEVAVQANEFESLPEKSLCEVEDSAAEGELKETNDIVWCSNSTAAGFPSASSHITKTIDETSSSGSSTHIKCDIISESTLKNSQFDSQMDGTFEQEFDFTKTLADGSITVNEFLSHFGANSVIHKSRPSALPENFRITQTNTLMDLLREKYIFRPKQRVYEADCQKLAELAEGFKMQMTEQDKALKDVNAAVLQDVCAFSGVQLQKFGGKLKERRGNFRKRSKALSHEIKEALYSELCKTTQESKQKLVDKISKTNEMLKDLDGCIIDLESELESVSSILTGDQHSLSEDESALKAKKRELDVLNSDVVETEKLICDLERQRVSSESLLGNLQEVVKEFENRIRTLNSLNEWQFCEREENTAVFSFLHNTVEMEVKLKNPGERGWICDVEQDVDLSFRFLLNGDASQPHARMVHVLLAEHIKAQPTWTQKYPTTRHIPVLLHNVSLVVSRLRLLGEEIHQLKKWGGLRFDILHFNCSDTLVEIVFSSIKACAKFELSLTVTPDYPLNPLQMQKFQNLIGKTRVDQIEDVLCSVTPAKNYLTNLIKKIHADLL
ncbi:kinetochore scaffold 1 isoform X2 [Astyanax mexicanus]|uniref:Kinetochore scaffold 1 isoform X2 n=1 Tax=Astyanax mexicanus TaxID=7994 RepID=A0A8T2KWP3_ASTMX|nr:kinetochore scaffold 1 isoform X2 [Astyanax mexicanus]